MQQRIITLLAPILLFLSFQSTAAAYNGYTAGNFLPGIKMAVSAMTVHVRLQQDGYQPILF